MKRKILVLFVLLSLLLTLAVSVCAASPHELTPSEDLQTVTLDGKTYVAVDTSVLNDDYSEGEVTVTLTEEQTAQYKKVKLFFWSGNPTLIRVDYHQNNGIVMQISYIREDLYELYMDLLEQETYTVRFQYPADNDAVTEKSLLCGEPETLYMDQLRKATDFGVYAVGEEQLTIHRGWLLVIDGEYYYVDIEENDLDSDAWLYSQPRVAAYKVTDPDLCARFDKAMEEHYGTGLGVLEDPEVTDRVSGIFMIIMFGFLPLAVLITFTVFAIVTKKPVYRVLYIIVCSCALLVLLAVVLTFLMV